MTDRTIYSFHGWLIFTMRICYSFFICSCFWWAFRFIQISATENSASVHNKNMCLLSILGPIFGCIPQNEVVNHIIFFQVFIDGFCTHVAGGRGQGTGGGQRTVCGGRFSPSTIRVLGHKLRLAGLAATTFTSWVISLVSQACFWNCLAMHLRLTLN